MKIRVDVVRAYFFDRKVADSLAPVARRVLSRFGAFVRTRARSLVNRPGTKANPTSRPGEPPRRHDGTLRKYIFFAYDPAEKAVVVGPAETNQLFFNGDGRPVKGTVPEVLEHGGEIRILEAFYPPAAGYPGRWMRADLRSRRRLAERETRMRTVAVAARPFMGEAFAAESPKLRQWKQAA